MSESSFPAWINKDYFQAILSSRYKNSSVEVQTVRVEPCGAGGFISTLLRVQVGYVISSEQRHESFIVKTSTKDEFALAKVGSEGYDVQHKEMLFFEMISERIEKTWKCINENETLVPQVLAVDRDHNAIILEDLTAKDFSTIDRMEGLDDAHTRLALKKLAKFHAASIVIQQKQPRTCEFLELGMFSRKNDSFNDYVVSIYEVFVEEVESWAGWETYAKKLRKLQPNFIEAVLRCFDHDPGDLCVLNHGDVWTSNLMFKYGANGEVTDAILVRISRSLCHCYDN